MKKSFALTLVFLMLLSLSRFSFADSLKSYIDAQNVCVFVYPDNWSLIKSDDIVLLYPDNDISNVLTYYSEDLYTTNEYASLGLAREDVNMSSFSTNNIAVAFEVPVNSVELVKLGYYEYYVFDISDLRCYVSINNGYYYVFMYSGSDEYIPDVENIIKYTKHTPEEVGISEMPVTSEQWNYKCDELGLKLFIPNGWVKVDNEYIDSDIILDTFIYSREDEQIDILNILSYDIWQINNPFGVLFRKNYDTEVLSPDKVLSLLNESYDNSADVVYKQINNISFYVADVESVISARQYIIIHKGIMIIFSCTQNDNCITEVETILSSLAFD